jgi:hypothetical protein
MNVQKNTKYLNLWRGEFSDNFKNRPRLYEALTECPVYFDGDDDMLTITFYVKNDIQQHWIEVVLFDELVDRYLTLSGVKYLEFRVLSQDDLPVAK